MAKKQNSKQSDGSLLSRTLFIIYVFVVTGCLIAGVMSLTSSLPENIVQTDNSDDTTTPTRVFDQTTASNVNNMTGSATGLPSGRSNPFSG